VAAQIAERFHPDDRLMLWFDFFDHDSGRVEAAMRAMMEEVVPRLAERGIEVRTPAGAGRIRPGG
jgi:hypothetical protein